jgi:hypothetical protein
MEEFDFDETTLSTSVDKLRKKKSELDDEKPYNLIYNNLYNELNTPQIKKKKNSKQLLPIIKKKKNIKNIKNIKNNKVTNTYYKLFIFSVLFLLVNNYELHIYLVNQKYAYYTIVIIKLILFIIINYIFKNLTKN